MPAVLAAHRTARLPSAGRLIARRRRRKTPGTPRPAPPVSGQGHADAAGAPAAERSVSLRGRFAREGGDGLGGAPRQGHGSALLFMQPTRPPKTIECIGYPCRAGPAGRRASQTSDRRRSPECLRRTLPGHHGAFRHTAYEIGVSSWPFLCRYHELLGPIPRAGFPGPATATGRAAVSPGNAGRIRGRADAWRRIGGGAVHRPRRGRPFPIRGERRPCRPAQARRQAEIAPGSSRAQAFGPDLHPRPASAPRHRLTVAHQKPAAHARCMVARTGGNNAAAAVRRRNPASAEPATRTDR